MSDTMNPFQDIRYALRQLRNSPGFTAIAVLTLTLGLGVNCALFSVVHAVLLRPLPYPAADRLAAFERTFPGDSTYQTSAAKYYYWREHAKSFADVSAQSLFATGINFTGAGEPERLQSLAVSANFFRTLGVDPSLGRSFTREEDLPGGRRAVVLAHGLWQRRFASDPNVIGKSIRLGNELYEVVGVTSANFTFTPAVDLWIPLRAVFDPAKPDTIYRVLGRLRPGVQLRQAQQEMAVVGSNFRREYPDLVRPDESVSVLNYHDSLVGDVRLPLLLLEGAVAFVLLIACANLANLMLGRSLARSREMAVRAALGAGRWRLLKQCTVESLLLALTGGSLGIAAASLALPLMLRLGGNEIPSPTAVRIDGPVCLFALAIAIFSGLAFGIVPALQASLISPQEVLQQNNLRSTSGRSARGIRQLLVMVEVSLSVVLLVGAGLLIETFRHLQNQNPGFDPRQVMVAQTTLDDPRFTRTQAVAQLQQQALARLEASTNIAVAASISTLPTEPSPETDFRIEGDPKQGDLDGVTAWRAITRRYFEVMRIPLLDGRAFSERDTGAAPGVVIVNQTLARQFFPGRNPIGTHIMIGQRPGSVFKDRPREIVGVVGDTREAGLDQPPPPAFFIPAAQTPDALTALCNRLLPLDWVVRTRVASADAAPTIRRALLAAAPQQPPANIRSAGEMMGASIARQRFSMLLLTVFAALALILGSIGLYGVLSFVVAQRTQEIGIRMSLGARRRNVLWLVLRHGMLWVVIGIAIGSGASFGLSRLMSALLYGVAPNDGATLARVVLLLLAVALLACYVPARRASQVDPMVALRYE
jgi:putative ABC transport system permease protein